MRFHKFALFLSVSLLSAQAPTGVARRALDHLLAERYADLVQMFTPEMRQALPEDKMLAQIGPQLKSLGRVEKIDDPTIQKSGEFDVYVFPVQFSSGALDCEFSVNRAQQIGGMFFRPPQARWQPAIYNKPESYREREVTVGNDPWKLPGTLSVPVGKGPFPGVVLVHGSGPNDRDETIFAIKVFKDLAQGLASHGIAVLRYEKRTKAHGAQMATIADLNVGHETVYDAVSAAALMRTEPGIDPKKVFVIGHSLGGYMGPRIAKQDGKLGGLIVMAGSVQPLEDIILEQTAAALRDTPSPERQRQLDTVKRQAEAVKQLDPAKNNPATLFGLPSSYFLDLKGYDPVALAKTLAIPMLILQGERDFQVTMKDFELWKSGLANQKGVTFQSYRGLSHLFVTGEGRGTLAEYQIPGHVSAQIIDDIAAWIAARK